LFAGEEEADACVRRTINASYERKEKDQEMGMNKGLLACLPLQERQLTRGKNGRESELVRERGK